MQILNNMQTGRVKGSVSIVAEAGTSHQGSLSAAEELIEAASDAGADIVKFQYVIASEIVHPLSGSIKLPGGMVPIYERFLELECSPDFYARLIEICKRCNIGFLCTPFGLESASRLHELGVKNVKIASPELNHTPLLKEVDSWNVPVILSAGVSKNEDIARAVARVSHASVLLHCITAYPAPEEEYNLNLIPALEREFCIAPGISDHSLHPWLVPALAVLKGAVMVEKHFTLSRTGKGLDDPIALDPIDFSLMVRKLRAITPESAESAYNDIVSEFGAEKVNAILGSGIKTLAPAEEENYYTTRRSVLAIRQIKAGEKADYTNCGLFRSEKNLVPGMEPDRFEHFLGKTFTKDIDAAGPVLESCFD